MSLRVCHSYGMPAKNARNSASSPAKSFAASSRRKRAAVRGLTGGAERAKQAGG